MSRVSTLINFPRSAENAFTFYRTVFGGEFSSPVQRFSGLPMGPGRPPMPEADKNLVMHIELPILGGHILMGADTLESMGGTASPGGNMRLVLEPTTRSETDRLFKALSVNGKVEMPPQDMFWGAYFGDLADQFGVHWMFNCTGNT
jgi:PhnB protein